MYMNLTDKKGNICSRLKLSFRTIIQLAKITSIQHITKLNGLIFGLYTIWPLPIGANAFGLTDR